MATDFLHGIEIIEVTDDIRPIETVKSSVIGLIGTAPQADAAEFPLNTPVILLGNQRKAAKLDTTADGTGGGTLKDAVDAIFDHIGAAVIVVRVAEGADTEGTIVNVVGDQTQQTGVHAFSKAQTALGYTPRILCAPGFTSGRVTDGVITINIDSGGSNYTSVPTVSLSGGGGQGAKATAVVNGGVVTAIQITKHGFGYTTPPTVTISGGGGNGAAATAVLGSCSNAVVAELVGIAEKLRAVIVADGPSTNDSAAINYRGDFGSSRVFVVDPAVLVYKGGVNVTQPASARVAGLIAKQDNENGFWWSPSNRVINGITGVARGIDFSISDPNSQANYLNDNEVATIVRAEGYRLWGNRTCSDDPIWAFLSVRRTADMVYESVEQAFRWAIDRPLTKNNILQIPKSVNAYLRTLIARGAIIGGKAWIDPELNTPADLMAGKLTVDFDIEPPAPLERLTFRVHRNSGYYTEVIEAVVRELSRNR